MFHSLLPTENNNNDDDAPSNRRDALRDLRSLPSHMVLRPLPGRSLAPAKTVATIRARGTFNKSGGVTPLKSCLKNSSARDPYTKTPRDFLATPRSAHRITTALGSMSSSWLSRSVTVSSVKKCFYR